MELDYSKNNGSNSLEISHLNNLEVALNYLKNGWPLIPLHYPKENGCSCQNPHCNNTAKHPMNKHGSKEPLRDHSSVETWWKRNPNSNFGILTGQETGLIVLDVDPRHGGDQSLIELENDFSKLPITLKANTGGGGYHFYFRHPGGAKIGNKVNIRPGLDIRGDGGYIIAPPSVHASKKAYQWENPESEISILPDWLQNIICDKKSKEIIKEKKPQANLEVSNRKASNKFLAQGNRNNGLLSIAGLLKSKGAENSEIELILRSINQAACEVPLEDNEVQKITQSISRYQQQPWPEPRELPDKKELVPMSAEMLPAGIRTWCVDISERMQVPLEFTAGPAIVMIASLIGRKVVALPNKSGDWEVIPNLWGCLVAPPGSLKSPTISAVLKPLNKLVAIARDKYLAEKSEKERQEIIAMAEIEALKDALKVAVKNSNIDKTNSIKEKLDNALVEYKEKHEIKEIRYVINDPTIEKLLTILENNPQGVLLYRDELGGWLESIMKKSGREGDREFFLESWNGDSSYSMDRIGRGHTFVEGLCLSVLGGLQPGKLESYVSQMAQGGKSDDGLLQRFQILLYPERRKTWKNVDREADVSAERMVENILKRIDQIPLPQRIDNKITRPHLYFSESAQKEFDVWRENLENRLCFGKIPPIMESHLSKYRSLMPSLALIFSIIEHFSNPESKFPESIDKESVLLAIKWCELLEDHAVKVYGEFLEPEYVAARKLLEKIKEGHVRDFDRCRDIYRKGWKGLTNGEELEAAIKILKEYGWIRTEILVPETGGKSEIIKIRPIKF